MVLAAGHRPCACCRRGDFVRFMECSQEAVPCKERWTAAHVDAVLHSERYAKDGQNILRTATLETLPHGVIVALDIVTTHDTLPDCWLKWEGQLHRWSHCG
mmetsp:Transcript_33408/g.53785  ORF Transcript_33408/g.53785 Transcript_33408/m.53785 type:complete len:101 (+) Transcript_33408:200-502(+)